MARRMENIIKDYLFIAILLGFIVYKIPSGKPVLVSEAPTIMSVGEFAHKEELIKNSILQTGVRLLDIKIELETSIVNKSNELVAFIKFDSFGDVPTLINLNYVIIDDHGQVVYEETGEVTVETEASITKEFKQLELGRGKYTLILRTLYNIDVRDEFRQTFEVKGPTPTEILSWIVLAAGLIIVGISIASKLVRPKSRLK